MSKTRLSESLKAYQAICGLLESSLLSEQTVRQLQNLKRLLELEISAADGSNVNDKVPGLTQP